MLTSDQLNSSDYSMCYSNNVPSQIVLKKPNYSLCMKCVQKYEVVNGSLVFVMNVNHRRSSFIFLIAMAIEDT